MQGLFRRVKNEIGDDLLRFATVRTSYLIPVCKSRPNFLFHMQAKSDSIDALEAYRARSEPTFLMYSVSVFFNNID